MTFSTQEMTFSTQDSARLARDVSGRSPMLVEGVVGRSDDHDHRLVDLVRLANTDIETSLVDSLSDDLHSIFDPVSDGVLPIYFGPLLGRLFLEGL